MQNWGPGQTRCIKGEVPMANRPFPSYKYSHCQNKAYCRTFLVKMSFICIRMKNKRECSSFSLDKKTIVISMASHLASLRNIGLGRLGNGLKEQKKFSIYMSQEVHCTVNTGTNHVWSAKWGYHMVGLGRFRNLGPCHAA